MKLLLDENLSRRIVPFILATHLRRDNKIRYLCRLGCLLFGNPTVSGNRSCWVAKSMQPNLRKVSRLKWVAFILDSYPESTQVALIGFEQVNDSIIRQYAIDNNYVIVTKDADFYDMNLVYGQPPKVIWLRMGNQSKAETIKTLLLNHAAVEQALIIEGNHCIEIV